MKKKRSTSMYLSGEAQCLLTELAVQLGLSKSSVVELLIREKAKREKIK